MKRGGEQVERQRSEVAEQDRQNPRSRTSAGSMAAMLAAATAKDCRARARLSSTRAIRAADVMSVARSNDGTGPTTARCDRTAAATRARRTLRLQKDPKAAATPATSATFMPETASR